MTIPQFLRFYQGYSLNDALNEYARTFFSLVNSMYQLEAAEQIRGVTVVAAGMAEPKDRSAAMQELQKQSEGLGAIIREVKTVKGK